MVTYGLSGKVAWVVGASGAIGQEVAALLAREGCAVAISSRSADSLATLATRLRAESGADVLELPMSIRVRDDIEQAKDRILAQYGRIDLLVNTTTVPRFGDFLELPDEAWQEVYETKFFGYLKVMRAVLPHMAEAGYGRIVNVSGRGGHQPTQPVHLPGMTANAAVNLMTKGLANMYGPQGVRINAVAPGPVRSQRYDAILAASQALGTSGSHAAASSFNTQPLSGQHATPEEIAASVGYLLSDAAVLINGIVLQTDGGSTAAL
jgi:3-oxoacyl-[acyl-carrier protein] reductase